MLLGNGNFYDVLLLSVIVTAIVKYILKEKNTTGVNWITFGCLFMLIGSVASAVQIELLGLPYLVQWFNLFTYSIALVLVVYGVLKTIIDNLH